MAFHTINKPKTSKDIFYFILNLFIPSALVYNPNEYRSTCTCYIKQSIYTYLYPNMGIPLAMHEYCTCTVHVSHDACFTLSD